MGHAVQVESFRCHPRAFLGFIPITVGLNLFFHTCSAVPGAMDDLAGIAVLDGVAQVLADPPRDERPALAHTEVMLQVVLDMIEELDAGALEGPSGDRRSPSVCS